MEEGGGWRWRFCWIEEAREADVDPGGANFGAFVERGLGGPSVRSGGTGGWRRSCHDRRRCWRKNGGHPRRR